MSSGDNSLFARHYIDYVYMPGVLLIVGTLIVKKEWTPFAALIAVAFGAYNFLAFRELLPCPQNFFSPFPALGGEACRCRQLTNRRGEEGPQA